MLHRIEDIVKNFPRAIENMFTCEQIAHCVKIVQLYFLLNVEGNELQRDVWQYPVARDNIGMHLFGVRVPALWFAKCLRSVHSAFTRAVHDLRQAAEAYKFLHQMPGGSDEPPWSDGVYYLFTSQLWSHIPDERFYLRDGENKSSWVSKWRAEGRMIADPQAVHVAHMRFLWLSKQVHAGLAPLVRARTAYIHTVQRRPAFVQVGITGCLFVALLRPQN
jgi:hypothetical protein